MLQCMNIIHKLDAIYSLLTHLSLKITDTYLGEINNTISSYLVRILDYPELFFTGCNKKIGLAEYRKKYILGRKVKDIYIYIYINSIYGVMCRLLKNTGACFISSV